MVEQASKYLVRFEMNPANVTFLLWQGQASKYLVRFEESTVNVTFLLWQRQALKYLFRFEDVENTVNVKYLL